MHRFCNVTLHQTFIYKSTVIMSTQNITLINQEGVCFNAAILNHVK